MHASESGKDPIPAAARRWLWISGGQAVSAPHAEPRKGLPSLTRAWQRRELSNFDYLMQLNLLAGRRLGDLSRYPLLPWVLDMTEPPDAGINSTQVIWPDTRGQVTSRRRAVLLSVRPDPPAAASRQATAHKWQGGVTCRAASGGSRRATSSWMPRWQIQRIMSRTMRCLSSRRASTRCVFRNPSCCSPPVCALHCTY